MSGSFSSALIQFSCGIGVVTGHSCDTIFTTAAVPDRTHFFIWIWVWHYNTQPRIASRQPATQDLNQLLRVLGVKWKTPLL